MTNVHLDGPGRQGRGLDGGALGHMASGASLAGAWCDWYIVRIVVRPDAQGQGIGGRLTKLTLDKADSAGGCYFEMAGERTRALYEKRGLRVRHELTPLKGGTRIWTMWRHPHPCTAETV